MEKLLLRFSGVIEAIAGRGSKVSKFCLCGLLVGFEHLTFAKLLVGFERVTFAKRFLPWLPVHSTTCGPLTKVGWNYSENKSGFEFIWSDGDRSTM